MIKGKTVFILGAGASAPYGYPTAKKLREEIFLKFPMDGPNYFRAKGKRDFEVQQVVSESEEFAKKFRDSSTKSIDLFLARNTEFMLMGKYAIIFRIFAAEHSSQFRELMGSPELDWYSYLYERMTDGLVKKEDYARFSENEVSFITFNYDRSLEHFLYESLLNSFSGILSDKIKEQLNHIRIIHIFGQVAGLEWQDPGSNIKYRSDVNSTNVKRLADALQIIYEQKENPHLVEAQELIKQAERVFFLGFGYAKENMEVLDVPRIISPNTKVYGTALGFTDKEILDLRTTFIQGTVPDQILGRNVARFTEGFRNLDCLGLLREFL